MSSEKDSEVLMLSQPDLLSVNDLIRLIKDRCPRLQNLETTPKERLVKIFRQVILPLPQRLYRTNRRGKILTSRRAKAGLEAKPRREGERPSFQIIEKSSTKRSFSDDRLKPPPDSSRPAKMRISSSDRSDLDKIIINDRRKNHEDREKKEERRRDSQSDYRNRSSHETTSSKKIILKRPSSSCSSSERRSSPSRHESSSKKQRTAIKWP